MCASVQTAPKAKSPIQAMNRLFAMRLAAMAWAILAGLTAWAQDIKPLEPASAGAWRVEFSPFTHHFRFDVDHQPVWSLGIERESPDQQLFGLMGFRNSFGQPSAYLYYGRKYNNFLNLSESFYAKLSVGLMYGYRSPFEDEVPLNYNGFSPAIIPALGWKLDNTWSLQVNFLGTAAVMFMASKKL
jgi:hypothetical protein